MSINFPILFTSAGRRVELLHAFQQAYAQLDLPERVVAVDIDPLAPTLHIANKSYIVPRLTSDEYIPVLLDICRQERVRVAFPLIDPDVAVLAAHRQEFYSLGTQVAVVSSASAAISEDKVLTAEFFERLGLLTPRSWDPADVCLHAASFPLFVKPRRGSAGKGAFKVRDERELSFFSTYVTEPIIQEFISGAEITSDVVCDLDGEVLAITSRERIEVRSGEVAKGVTVCRPDILTACIKIAEALPAVGPITVQCILQDEVPYFTEINARFGGGIPLGIAAGAKSPLWLLARLAGLPIDLPPVGTYETGLYLSRFDDSLFITANKRAEMAGRHLRP
jgi:carbamoyl-phosphate synthase large subunit